MEIKLVVAVVALFSGIIFAQIITGSLVKFLKRSASGSPRLATRIIGSLEVVFFAIYFYSLLRYWGLDKESVQFSFAVIGGWFAIKTLSFTAEGSQPEEAENAPPLKDERYIYIIGTLLAVLSGMAIGCVIFWVLEA